MASKSILPSVDLGEKSPFNKKLTVLLVLLALGAVTAAALLGRTASLPVEEDKTKLDEVPFTEGTSRNIQLEFDAPLPKAQSKPNTHADTSETSRSDTRSNPQPGGVGMPTSSGQRAGSNSSGVVNNAKEDLEAQAAISAISVPYENAAPNYSGKISAGEKTAEQKIAELFPNIPERISEQEALNRSIAMASSAQSSVPGVSLDQSAPTALASKTKRFVSETEQQNKVKISRKNAAVGQWVVTSGKTIPAITKRAQNSDLPCAVEAITSVDVYDSYTSTKLLIPKGSEVIGVCSNDVAYGQNRILSLFSRLILPNGEWFDLSGGVGMDRAGATGLKGDVDNHFMQMFTSAFLVAFTADRVENRNRNTPTNNVYMSNSAGAKTAAGQVLVDTSQFMLNRSKHIQPTIDVEAGTRIYIQVKHDMVFD